MNEADSEDPTTPRVTDDVVAATSRFLPVAMASALFMDLLDTAALGAALPTMAREFHTDALHLKFALTAYLMTMAILVPASGWLADRFGARRVFIHAVRVYLLGSLCCGFSNSVTQLVAARVLQGIGGAMMTPVARLIVVASTPRERLVQAMNAFTLPAIVGPLMGPPLAGLLLQIATWRWIFFINLPVGVIGIVAVLRIVPRLRHRHPGPFDRSGFILAAIGIVAVILLSESISSDLLTIKGQVLVAAGAVAAWAIFIYHALRVPAPMLELRLLAKPTYRASMLGGSLLRLGIGATPFLLPLLLQEGLGWSPIKAGTVMAAMTIGSVLARFGGTYAVQKFGFRTALAITAALTAAFTAAPALFDADTSLLFVVTALGAVGFFRAAHYVASTAIAFADVSPEEISRASTLSTVIQQISLSFGISFAGVTLYLSAGTVGRFSAQQFILPFVSLGVAALLAVPVYTRLDSRAGALMRLGAKRTP
jgi:EmrB/QacA subfamily drug resistance transporter